MENNIIYLQRHTKPMVKEGLCYGQTDLDLFPKTMEAEIMSVLKNTEKLSFSKVYTSPLKRCLTLAEAICQQKGFPPPTMDVRLMEMNFGEWEMCAWEDIFRSPKGKEWFTNYMECCTPKGESFLQVMERSADFFRELDPEGNVLLVTHDGFIRASLVRCGLLDIDHAFDERYPYGVLKEIHTANTIKR